MSNIQEFNFSSDIVIKEPKHSYYLHFFAKQLNAKRGNYEALLISFAVGLSVFEKDNIFSDNTDVIEQKSKEILKGEEVLGKDFNVPRTIISPDSHRLRIYFIIAQIVTNKQQLSNLEMQDIWKSTSNALYKEAYENFINICKLGIEYIINDYMNNANQELAILFSNLEALTNKVDIISSLENETEYVKNPEQEMRELREIKSERQKEILELDVRIDSLESEILNES